MGERQGGFNGTQTMLSFCRFQKETRCHMSAAAFAVCWRGTHTQRGPSAQSFTKVTGNTSSPHNLFRVKLPFANSAGLHLMWPH